MLMKVHTDVNITVLSTRDFLFNLYNQKRQEIVRQITLLCLSAILRGKHFLLFLPDFHSAYYNSFMSALGRSLPPSLDLSRICT